MEQVALQVACSGPRFSGASAACASVVRLGGCRRASGRKGSMVIPASKYAVDGALPAEVEDPAEAAIGAWDVVLLAAHDIVEWLLV